MLELAALQRPFGGDNAPSNRVTPRDFKPRKPVDRPRFSPLSL